MAVKRVSVVGLGYIGLPTAAVIASRGIDVIGVDVVQSVVDTINRGEIHIVEPDLDIAVRSAVQGGKLMAYTEPQEADAFLIAVPTPFCDGYQPDLSYIESASRSVARVLKPGNTVILESTSPVGATEKMAEWLAEERPDLSFPHQNPDNPDIHIAHCPERVLPGQVLRELVDNDRVIGGVTEACSDAASAVYGVFVKGELVRTDVRTAEMCKLVENSFRDVNIAFANELSIICDRHGINVWELISLANRHPRVNILQPGTGVGGHCIAVDPWFIVSQDPESSRLIRTAREVNDYKPDWVSKKVLEALAAAETDTLVFFGLAFKPNIDDTRESPAVSVVSQVSRAHMGKVLVVDPHIDRLPKELEECGNVSLLDIHDLPASTYVAAFLVAHDRFSGLAKEIGGGAMPKCVACLDFVSVSQR